MRDRKDACPAMLQHKPPRIAMTLLLLAGVLQLLAPSNSLEIQSSATGGLSLTLLGCAIMLRAWWLFREQATAVCPTSETTVLITTDIYSVTRNPMYLGILAMLIGLAIGTGGIFFYLASLAFFLIIDYVFCPFEEAKLQRDFAAAYADYRTTVRRWL